MTNRAGRYHRVVRVFKRRLIEATLLQTRGNRTHAARALGLQRTYLCRLVRELRVAVSARRDARRKKGPDASGQRG